MSSELPPDPYGDATPCQYTEYREGGDVEDLPATGEDAEGLEADVWEALYDVEDPEMPISIVDLGLIYGVDATDGEDGDGANVTVAMTLTYTGCPARDMLLSQVEEEVAAVDGVVDASVQLVWSPEWTLELVTEQGTEDLREFGLSV
jgi:metal-sulfur cluster biosynthetic enzyme